MSKETGGAAFPSAGVVLNEKEVNQYQQGAYEGMTLRDYYMAHAPITVEDAMFAARIEAHSVGMLGTEQRETVFRFLALLRGEYADAMIDPRVAP